MTCSEAGCGRSVLAKGLCSLHYDRARRANPARKCSMGGCDKQVHGHGLCMNHYLKARRRKAVPHKPCEIAGCERVAEVAGRCVAHHFRIVKYDDPDFRKRVANGEQTPERKRATAKKCQDNYRKTPHGRLRQSVKDAKRRLRQGQRIGSLTRDQSAQLWSTTHCALCGKLMSDEDKSLDHKTPLARGGTNDFHNLQIAHLLCNQRKSDRAA